MVDNQILIYCQIKDGKDSALLLYFNGRVSFATVWLMRIQLKAKKRMSP